MAVPLAMFFVLVTFKPGVKQEQVYTLVKKVNVKFDSYKKLIDYSPSTIFLQILYLCNLMV